MKLPYKISEAGRQLYKAGVSYHEFGTVKQSGKAMFDYYKCDRVTDEQLRAIREYCPDLKLSKSVSCYAPELSSTLLMFPKSAYYKAKK